MTKIGEITLHGALLQACEGGSTIGLSATGVPEVVYAGSLPVMAQPALKIHRRVVNSEHPKGTSG